MIRVERPPLAEVGLVGWGERAASETRSMARQMQRDPHAKFKVQRQLLSEVRGPLLDLFHGKCAFCETSIAQSFSGEIAHFRPNRQIEEESPGYWWLTYDWGESSSDLPSL